MNVVVPWMPYVNNPQYNPLVGFPLIGGDSCNSSWSAGPDACSLNGPILSSNWGVGAFIIISH